MERYARHIVYRRYTGPGRADPFARPHASFDTLDEAAEYVGYADLDDQHMYTYSVLDVEHIHRGDMLKHREHAAIVAEALAVGRARWEDAA
jgi:hypothetical protein